MCENEPIGKERLIWKKRLARWRVVVVFLRCGPFMGQGNLRGRAAHIHSHGTELMPGIAALDRLRGGAISMRKELEQMGKKKNRSRQLGLWWWWGSSPSPPPPTIASCILSGECWSVHELEGWLLVVGSKNSPSQSRVGKRLAIYMLVALFVCLFLTYTWLVSV